MKPEPYRRRSLIPGIAISLSLHAGLLAWVIHQRAPLPPAAAPSRWLTVSLLPAPVTPQPVPRARQPDPPPLPAREGPPGRLARTPPKHAPEPITETPPRQASATEQPAAAAADVQPAALARTTDAPDPFATPAAPQPGAFDTNAALKSARRLAIAKAGKDDPAVAQLRDKPVNGLADDSALGKDIKKGARPGCLMAGAGAGILAPLAIAAMVLTDKKDSGCKW